MAWARLTASLGGPNAHRRLIADTGQRSINARSNVIVTANQSNFVHPSHTFTIDLKRHNFRKDLADRYLTLVIENTNPSYSYVYFYGHTGSPVGP